MNLPDFLTEDADGFPVVGRVEAGEGVEFLLGGKRAALSGYEHFSPSNQR